MVIMGWISMGELELECELEWGLGIRYLTEFSQEHQYSDTEWMWVVGSGVRGGGNGAR